MPDGFAIRNTITGLNTKKPAETITIQNLIFDEILYLTRIHDLLTINL